MRARLSCAALLLLALLLSAPEAHALTTGAPHRPAQVEHIIPEYRLLDTSDAQQTICIALAVYHEARGMEQRAQFAVAHVVLNRVRDSRYPKTPCAVVWQKGKKRSAFQWTRNTRRIIPKELGAWEAAQRIAYLVTVDPARRDPSHGSTHFHERGCQPDWAAFGYNKKPIGTLVFMKVDD